MLRQIGTQFELFMVSKIQVSQWLTKKKTNFFQWNQSMDKHIKHHIKLEFQENHRTLCYEYKNVILWKRLVNAPPTSLIDSTQHFGGGKARWSSEMGIRTSDKQVNYSHEPSQTKQQVVQWVVETPLVHKQSTCKHRLIRLTTTWTWGKTPPSPLKYSLCLAMVPTPKCHFVPGLPSWESSWES